MGVKSPLIVVQCASRVAQPEAFGVRRPLARTEAMHVALQLASRATQATR